MNLSIDILKHNVGSTEAQVCYLTEKVFRLSYHLQKNPKDFSSQRGLRKILGQRKNLLTYLSRKDEVRYTALLNQLGIRGLKNKNYEKNVLKDKR